VLTAAAGTYTLTVDAVGDAAGAYGFRLSDVAAAMALTPATPQAGDLTPATETDLYRFDANAGDRVYFDVVETNDGGNTIWQLVSPFNVVLFRTNNFSDVATLTLPSTGTYTLLVEAWRLNTGADTYTINVVPQVETAPTALVINDTANGTIDFAGERDRYTFTLGAAALLYFDSLTNSANFNWTLAGPPGTVVNARVFSSTDSFDFVGNPALNLPAGDYTLTVGGAQSAVGAYSFRLSNLATVTQLTPGTPQAGTLSPPNESDVYRFDASAGDRVYFDIVATSDSANSIWQVINPLGFVVFRAGNLTDVATLTLPSTGSYSVLVEGWRANTGDDTYTLNIVKQTDIAPSPLILGSMVTGTLDVAGERERHTFSVGAPTLVYFDAQTNNAGLNWTLSGPAGVLVDSRSFTATDSFDFTGNPAIKLVPGDYTVTIGGDQSTMGAYAFRLSDLGAAATITPGTEFSGELTLPTETDLYRFSASAGDRFIFEVVTASDTSNTVWQLISSFGVVIFRSGFFDTATLTLPSTGDYTLLVEGWRANTGVDTYTLNVVPQGNVPPPSPSGTALTLGSIVSDTIAVAGEVDGYVFTLAADARLYFDSFTNSGQIFWSLTGPAGVVVNSRTFSASDSADIANPALDLGAGTYGLTVAAGAGVTGGYSFRLLDFTAATPLTPGTPVSGAIDPMNETDLYRFAAAAGERFYFDVTARTGAGSTRWRLINPFGAVVFERAFSADLVNSDTGPLTLAAAGTYTLLIEPRASETSTGTYTFNVHPLPAVAPTALTIGDAHFVNAGPDLVINEGATVNLAPAAYTDAGTTILLTTARIDWGDGTPVQAGTVDQVLRTVAGSHTYADNGVYTVTVTVFNDDWGDRSDTFTVTVNNVNPALTVVGNQTLDEGAALDLPNIGTFTDPAFNNPLNPPPGEVDETFTFEILWGDGLASTGTATIDQLGGAAVLTAGSFDGSHVYADNGVYTVTVRVFDDDGGMDQETFQVTVNNVAPTLTVVGSQAVNEGQPLGVVNIGTFADPGFDNAQNPLPGETAETFTFEINWGDGTPLSIGTATIDTPGAAGAPTAGSFDGSHVFADNGAYTVVVRVFDDDGGMDEETFQVTVGNLAPTLAVVANQTANEGQTLSITDLGSFTDAGFNNPLNPPPGETEETFTFEINWGDGQPLDTGTATIDTLGGAGVLTAGSLDGSHVYAEHGVYTVTVRVFDDDGGMDEETFQATVNDAPTVAAPIADLTVDEDAAAVLDHAALDAVFADTDNPDSELTYTVAAVTPAGIVTATIGPDDTLDLSFAANASGIVDVTVRATDPQGLLALDTFRVTVHPVNDDPTVTAPIADRTVLQGAAPVLDHADLNAVFGDVDNTDAELTYTVAANTGAGIVTATIGADDTLDLGFVAAQNGIADITIRATDPQGGFVEDTFRVTVLPRTATTTTITQSTPAAFGQPATFTVTVVSNEPGGDLPTGTLTFSDGATVLGTSTELMDVGGVATATFATAQLLGGAHTITAQYEGDALYAPSASAGFAHTVSPAATTPAVTLSGPSPSTVGQVVTFTVTVTPGANGILPTGTLTLMDGATTLGVSTPLTDVGGVATATFTTTAGQLAVGARSITAVYAGDANFAGAASAVFTHTVNPLTAVPDIYNAKKDKKLKVSAAKGVLVNDGQTGVQAKLVKKPKKGKLVLKANGSFTYTPAPGSVGKVTFTYRLSSVFGVSAPVTVTIRIK